MHWRLGEHMLQTGQIIRADAFSHTHLGEPMVTKEWLSELIFALAGRWAGLFGLCLVAAVVVATTFTMLHRRLLREGNDFMASTLLVIMACWASSIHWMARPHVFSFLLIFLWNDALRRFERNGHGWVLTITLAVLMAVWVNLHGAFLAGMFVLAGYWLGAVVDWVAGRWTRDEDDIQAAGRRVWQLSVAGVVSLLASMLNPAGPWLLWHNLQFLRSKFFTGWLAEYASLDFHKLHSLGFMAWLALTFLVLTLIRPRWRPSGAVLLLMWTYFALYAGRNVPLYVIIVAPLLAPAVSEAVRGRLRQVSDRVRAMSLESRGWGLIVLLFTLWLVRVPRETPMSEEHWPVAALEHVRQNPDLYQGHMFNQYINGGYLLWFLPEHKVFIDGRADFFGEEFVKEFDAITRLRPGWQDLFEKYDIAWTLLPVNQRLNSALELLPSWEETYRDDVAVIYRRVP
jgi:hypothetical protein